MRSLSLLTDDGMVGTLVENNDLWVLEYAADWLNSESGFDLSPHLPRSQQRIADGSTRRPVQWFFDNLLPEEGLRAVLARDARLDQDDAFGLLGYFGAESVGALTLLPSDAKLPAGDLRPLDDLDLNDRIEALPRESMQARAPKKMSLAGAQHKVPLVLDDAGQLYEPVGARASTHIGKPDHPDGEQYPCTVANEWFCMRLDDRVGLPVPAVEIRRLPRPIFLIRRFDRVGPLSSTRRRHVIDGCQLLNLARTQKYRGADPGSLSEAVSMVRTQAQARQGLFRWLAFCVVIGNNDAHLKNLSFFTSADGITLAPHYDLLCTTMYPYAEDRPPDLNELELPMPMGDAQNYGQLKRRDVLDAGAILGLPDRVAVRLLDELLASTTKHARALTDQIDAELPANESRLLRQVVHNVLLPLAARLSH